MEQKRIRELLGKFYEGLTSEEEESELKKYFQGGNAHPDLKAEGILFSTSEVNIPEPSGNFLSNLENITNVTAGSRKLKRIPRYILSAAAGLALLMASYYLFTDNGRLEMNDTFNDPELAMAEVKSILSTVSHNMKAGTEPLSSIRMMSIAPQTINDLGKMNKAIDNSLEKLQYLNRLSTLPQTTEKENKE